MKTAVFFRLLLLGAAALIDTVTAQEINEDELFGDAGLVLVDSSIMVTASTELDGLDSTVASFSGQVTSVAAVRLEEPWFSTLERQYIAPSSMILSNCFFDVRLPFNVKSFADAEIHYVPGVEEGLTLTMPELFLDLNIAHRVYFRTGKQVLQWGRGYFWNPTDLVNVERKSFIPKIGSREGTYGIKAHIPFGTTWNIYGFLDMNELGSVDSLAGAARLELLVGGTEMGIALWGKRLKDPVFGFDFSRTVFTVSVTGEMSITRGTNYIIPDVEHSALLNKSGRGAPLVFTDAGSSPVIRLSAGLMRMFDLLDVDDRMTVVTEFYYNGAGLGGNIFEEYALNEAIGQLGPSVMTMDLSLAKYYGAYFVTVNKFLLSEMSLQCNGMVNFNQQCAVLATGVTYTTLHNLSIGALCSANVGPHVSEYTFMGRGAMVRVTAGIIF